MKTIRVLRNKAKKEKNKNQKLITKYLSHLKTNYLDKVSMYLLYSNLCQEFESSQFQSQCVRDDSFLHPSEDFSSTIL